MGVTGGRKGPPVDPVGHSTFSTAEKLRVPPLRASLRVRPMVTA